MYGQRHGACPHVDVTCILGTRGLQHSLASIDGGSTSGHPNSSTRPWLFWVQDAEKSCLRECVLDTQAWINQSTATDILHQDGTLGGQLRGTA